MLETRISKPWISKRAEQKKEIQQGKYPAEQMLMLLQKQKMVSFPSN